jgi:ATP-dependent Clp protease adapter protein ClpS
MGFTLLSSGAQTIDATDTDAQLRLEDMYEVILFNDDVNAMEHVIESLMVVFNHTEQLAMKIMIDAHRHGRAVAEVEERELARQHKGQLESRGLTVSIEKV